MGEFFIKTVNYKNKKGITLIALTITIIVLLILAGVSIAFLTGDNGILSKSESAKEQTNLSQAKEELQLYVGDEIANLTSNGKQVNMNDIVNYLSDKVDSISAYGTDGKYKNYSFYIDKSTYQVIMGDKTSDQIVSNDDNAILFDGSTYISTNLQESQIFANSTFTIASRVYIDRSVQETMQYMDILGNHYNTLGIRWQFVTNTNTLDMAPGVQVDYTQYYNKWTNIVMTYNNGTVAIFINGQKIQEQTGITITAYNNFLIGTGFIPNDRAMRGMISSVKVWTRTLSNQEIQNIDMYNNIITSDSNLILQLDFKDLAQVQGAGTIVGTNYRFVQNKNSIKYAFKFNGSTYLNTNIPESQIFSKGTFTIAARVYITRAEQQTVNYMDILRKSYWKFWTCLAIYDNNNRARWSSKCI